MPDQPWLNDPVADDQPWRNDPVAATGAARYKPRSERGPAPRQREGVRYGNLVLPNGAAPTAPVRPATAVERRARPAPPRVKPETRRDRTQREGEAYARTQAGVSGDAQLALGSGVLRGLGGMADTAWMGIRPAEAFSGGPMPSAILGELGWGYTPQTDAGSFAEGAGMMLPNALAPGSALARTAAVVLPTIAGEAGRIATRGLGYDEQSQENVRGLSQFVGGLSTMFIPQRLGEAVARGARGAASRPAPPRVRGRPEQVARLESARDLPVQVPLRRGDMTRNPVDQIRENMTLRGAYGEKAAAQMQEIVATQREALRGNVDAIAENIGAGARRPLREGGTPAAETLDAMRQRAEKWVNSAYDAARATGEGAVIPAEAAMGARYSVLEGLNDFTPVIAPKAFGIVDELAGNGGPIQLRDVFTTRQRLSSLRADGGVEGAAAGRAVRALDGFISSAVDDGIVQGDPQAVAAWRQAIAANAKKAELFQGDDLIETLTERVSRNGDRRALAVDPREAGDAIFGVGNSLGRRANQVRDLERMRDVLGEGPEWNAVRAEHFQRLASRADGAMEGGVRQFSGANLNKSWQDFLRDNRALADTLYTPEEQAQITQFAELAADITSPVRGGDNPSNTAAALLSIMPRFIRSIPGLGQWVEGIGRDVIGNATVRAARNPRPQPPPPRLPVPPARAILPGAIAATASPRDREAQSRR